MLHLSIRSVRGISEADIDLGPFPVLIAARNGEGKTTICQALASTVTGNPLPIAGLTKKAAGVLVRDGAERGSVRLLNGDAGETLIAYPDAEVKQRGKMPSATPYAVGLADIPALDAKQRSNALQAYIRGEPSKEEILAELKRVSVDDKTAAKVVEAIGVSGWDGAHGTAVETGRRNKGAWEEVTGQKHGSKVAQGWTPVGWRASLESTNLPDLTQVKLEADLDLEAAIAANASDSAIRGELTALAGEQADRTRTREQATKAVQAAEEELAAAVLQRDALPSPEADPEHNCPECGALLQLLDGALVKSARENLSAQEVRKRKAAITQADKLVAELTAKVNGSRDIEDAAKAAEAAARNAAERLAAMPPPLPTGDASAVETARAAAQAAANDCLLFQKWQRAATLGKAIETNVAIVGVLAPDGLRKTVLARKLEEFNKTRLLPFCTAAKWRPVEIGQDLGFTYGGRPYALLSESERFRVCVVMRAAVAAIEDAPFIIVDAADILDPGNRNGLFAALQSCGVPAVVAMTMPKPESVPAIPGAYWLADGVLRPLREVLDQARAAA